MRQPTIRYQQDTKVMHLAPCPRSTPLSIPHAVYVPSSRLLLTMIQPEERNIAKSTSDLAVTALRAGSMQQRERFQVHLMYERQRARSEYSITYLQSCDSPHLSQNTTHSEAGTVCGDDLRFPRVLICLAPIKTPANSLGRPARSPSAPAQ